MKKFALILAVITLFAMCMIPASAAETKTIKFAANIDDQAYLAADQSDIDWFDNGDKFYSLTEGKKLVFKFTLEEGVTNAAITMPAFGFYEILAGNTIDGAKVCYTSKQAFNDGYTEGSTDKWNEKGLAADEYTSVFEPLAEQIDLTSAVNGTELYVILRCTKTDKNTGLWDMDQAVSNSIKYVNRRWNLVNGFSKDGGEDGSRTKTDAVAGEQYSDGLITLIYTVADAAAAETAAEPAATAAAAEAPAAVPAAQTADLTAAAIIALAAFAAAKKH